MRWFNCFTKWKINLIFIKNVKDKSSVNVNINSPEIIDRQKIEISDIWFNKLLELTYDAEIKSKYIPQLHTISNIEESYFLDIIDFKKYIFNILNQIKACCEDIACFQKHYKNLEELIEHENLSLNESNLKVKSLNNFVLSLSDISKNLAELDSYLATQNYEVLSKTIIEIVVPKINYGIDFYSFEWEGFSDKEPSDKNVFKNVFKFYREVHNGLNDLNTSLKNYDISLNCKILIGNAGSGKTHFCAHLIKKIQNNNDYAIFFKPKQFNGDNVELNQRLLNLLQIPEGYTLHEVLSIINDFVQKKNRRCFIIIDALNETTKASIGFSNIWYNYLQGFINLINQYSHIQLICTLRSSYVENIWEVKPLNLIEIKGFKKGFVKEACMNYFGYYNIKPINLDSADLTIFENPLLLDLYSKFIKDDDGREIEIQLDMQTYVNVFENYISKLIKEVKFKLGLQKDTPILAGFIDSSLKFYNNNEAIISVGDFTDSFDKDDLVKVDNSISRAVLEGYLIFIKDIIAGGNEIVKHTQQEVGGYLIAKSFIDTCSDVKILLKDEEFQEKILKDNNPNNHQLRLDILKFLIALNPELITKISEKESLRLSWWYLYNGYSTNSIEIPEFLISNPQSIELFDEILDLGYHKWFDPEQKFNFDYLSRILNDMDRWTYDKNWTFYIYKNADFFYDLIKEYNKGIIDGYELDHLKLVAKLIAYTLSTTIRGLRDLATLFLIEYGKQYPGNLLELTVEFVNHIDVYIYERLVSCCYGVCLIMQNKKNFTEEYLAQFADRLYKLQFNEASTEKVLNYIVIDSIKHLVDLAILKGVYYLDETERNRLSNYSYDAFIWNAPSSEQKKLIKNSSEMHRPEPIGMDFGIYTIPRLVHGDEEDFNSMSNIYAKIYEDGYINYSYEEFKDDLFKEFYFGERISSYIEGKIDRLGKKYSWNAFFAYAGYLLQQGKLDVFERHNEEKYYRRLSDVDIDISLPNKKYEIEKEIFNHNLLSNRANNSEWYKEIFIDKSVECIKHIFEDEEYLMLNGFIDQRLNDDYKVRSLLILETVFINKNENFEKAIDGSLNKIYDWKSEVSISNDHIRGTYFGELYWGDNVAQNSEPYVTIPTGRLTNIESILTPIDIFSRGEEYTIEDIGKTIRREEEEKIYFEAEATMAEFLWETNSNVIEGFSENYPSVKMGKELKLVADPLTGNILDRDLKQCYKSVIHKEGFNSQSFNYVKKELLKEYMDNNNLALLFQIKQHSYDENYDHTRKLKFFIFDSN